MRSDFQIIQPQTERKVMVTLKKKNPKAKPLPLKKTQILDQSEDSGEEQMQENKAGQLNSISQWGNQFSGSDWINHQKKNHKFEIVNQSEAKKFSSKQYNVTLLQVPVLASSTSSNELYDDTSFPKNQKSITGEWGVMKKYQDVYWQRASKKLPSYDLFTDKVSPKSLIQGKLGDCYFLAAFAALAQRPDRIFKVFLTNELNSQRRFQVKLLLKGKWHVVQLDQYFAFQKDKIQFSRSTREELWIMVIEKAWAKLYGSYMNIKGGHAEECLHDFTGAPIKFFNLKSKKFDPDQFWKYMVKASKRQYPMCASSNVGADTKMSQEGIVLGHAYTLLKAIQINFEGQKVRLLKLRNPWGRKEGRGNWNDTDSRWKKVSAKQKQKLQYEKNNQDGIFFMELQDFVSQYRGVVIGEVDDNASYIYQTCKDPNIQGVIFKLKISETARYSLQVDKTPKRLFNIKKQGMYKYPVAYLKVFSKEKDYNQIHNYSDSERLTSRKYTLKQGVYFVFVMIQFEPQFQTEFDVTLAVYSQHACEVSIASASERRKIGDIELPSQKQLVKKRHKTSPKPTLSESPSEEAILGKANVKFTYATNAISKPNVQIKNKIQFVSREIKKEQNQIIKKQGAQKQINNVISKVVQNQKSQIVKADSLNLVGLIEKQVVFIEESPAQNKLNQLRLAKKDFIDERFPPNLASLTGEWGQIAEWKNVRWERISKVMPKSRIFSETITPNSIRQGFLGNCYFLATLAALAEKPHRILNLFLLGEKNEINYYSVKLLYRGKWLTIDMDDYIPYLYDLPAFSYAVNNELWVILLEKAWAKVYSSYKRIQAGFPEQALHDLTAAPIRHIYMQKPSFKPEQEWHYLMNASNLLYSMVASSQVGSDALKSVSGIVQGHAYTLLKTVQIRVKGQIRRLVQLRNPWGKGEGATEWCDDSKIWDQVQKSEKQRIGYQKKDDGIFFMNYQLFCKQFKIVTVAEINDNASYIYLSCEDSKLQGCFFTVNILKQGRYSWQVDNTPQRCFENHYHTDYQYPNIEFHLGLLTQQQYVKRLVQLTSNSRGLYHSKVVPPGVYVCFVKINFNPKFEKVFDINLAIYGDFPCELRLATKKQAVMLANNPKLNWPPETPAKQTEWNTLRSYNKSSKTKPKY